MKGKGLLTLMGATFLALILVALPLMAACAKPAPAPAKEWPKQIRFLAGSVGGENYGIHAFWASEVSKALKIPCGAFPGGNVNNMEPLNNSEGEFSSCSGDVIHNAYYGKEPFGKQMTNLRLAFGTSVAQGWFATRVDSPIKSITELNGKRVALPAKGMGSTKLALAQLEAAGITPDTIAKAGGVVSHMGYPALAPGLADGSLDAVFVLSASPNVAHVAVKLIEEKWGIRILEMPEDAIQTLLKKGPFYIKGAVPGGVYKGSPEPTYIVCSINQDVTRGDLPEDFVYAVMKIIFSDKVLQAHKERFKINPELGDTEIGLKAFAFAELGVPVHPGAAKFWEEYGGVDLAARGITVK